MRPLGRQNKAKAWARLALKWGFLLAEPRVWSLFSDQLRSRVDDVSDTVARKFDAAAHGLAAAGDALRGRQPRWPRMASFFVGMGIGAGLGVLLAPAPGRETREALRDRAVEGGNKVAQSFSTVTGRVREAMPPTGTSGD